MCCLVKKTETIIERILWFNLEVQIIQYVPALFLANLFKFHSTTAPFVAADAIKLSKANFIKHFL